MNVSRRDGLLARNAAYPDDFTAEQHDPRG